MIGPERRLAGNLDTDGQVGFALSADRQRPARRPIITRAARTGPRSADLAFADRYAVAGPTIRPAARLGDLCVCRASRAHSPMQVSDQTTSRALLVAASATVAAGLAAEPATDLLARERRLTSGRCWLA
jgi:hypothetical protein